MRRLTHSSLLHQKSEGCLQSQGLISIFSGLFLFTNMILRYALFILQITCGCNGCFTTKTRPLTNSYLPVVFQILHHYNIQLQEYIPYTYTQFCGFGKRGGMVLAPPKLSTDICVDESVRRINLFLIDLQREAMRQNMEDFQGFDHSVLSELKKTSHLTSVQQFHFFLKKLQKEGIGNAQFEWKISKFLHDLEDKNSKLYRNLLNTKPLNYLF